MKEIDIIDSTILVELLKDGRKPFVDIAEQCGVSKDVIWKHYHKMRLEGIIVGATTQIYPQKVGYAAGIVTVQINVESQGINDVLNSIEDSSEVYLFRQYNGRYNVGSISRLKSLRDLERIKRILSRNSLVNEIKTNLWTDVRNIPENIIKSIVENEPIAIKSSAQHDGRACPSSVEIDEIDHKIVDKLTINGRASFRNIGKELGYSSDTIQRRYENLRMNNVTKVTIQIDATKLGYQAILDTSLSLTKQDETDDVVDRISTIPGVSYILKVTGDYDLQVVTLVGDCKDIIAINEQIEEIPHIKRQESLIRNFRPKQEAWPGQAQHISTF